MSQPNLIPAACIERRILLLRGEKVMLDFDLAELYGVPTKVFNQAVKRNAERFPEDFMFRLSIEETKQIMRSQIVTASQLNWSQSVTSSKSVSSKPAAMFEANWSQIVTSSKKHRGLAYRPYAFTEQGVAMLSGVLNSPRAIQTNLAIMRTFVQLRQMLSSNADLARKLATLEGKYDKQFRVVFDAIRALMSENKSPKREIGFHTLMPKPAKSGGAKAKKI
jgi:hypothetical protein